MTTPFFPSRAWWILPMLVVLLDPDLTLGEIVPNIEKGSNGYRVSIEDGDRQIFSAVPETGSLTLVQPDLETTIVFEEVDNASNSVTLDGGQSRGLSLSETYRTLSPTLLERTVTVTASSDERYFLDFGWKTPVDGSFHSFQSAEETSQSYSPSCSGPEFSGQSMQTFPFLGVHHKGTLYGILGDSPGRWENRCFMNFDLENRILSLRNGDGSPKRTLVFPPHLDATTVYRGTFDGWQHIERGETQSWTTWIFSSSAETQYDIQLAAHLALANAKGFNQSGLEAILRNTSYLLLRRNLLRPESDHIFISGVGYGWKQWVTDGFWMSRGLDDPGLDVQAHAAVFYDRVSYEDNAQVYLIWSALAKRRGVELDPRTIGRAYHFMRDHEKEGLFIPPRLKPEISSFKTYMDLLPYDDDDAPSSNQGFHCGALLAARELGFEVSDEDIAKAIAGYRRMFNEEKGYLATSLKQQEHIGQDALYGEVLTYAVFGVKLLPDEIVQKHLETTKKIQSPFGMRVISKANGDLLDGHSGSYVWGGSWFLVDGANYLAGLIHGMDPDSINRDLLDRLEKELAYMPAFHESINTVDGKPHGHHLYSWNSGFWWLRKEVLSRMGRPGDDWVETELDRHLGIRHEQGHLVLDPPQNRLGKATAATGVR